MEIIIVIICIILCAFAKGQLVFDGLGRNSLCKVDETLEELAKSCTWCLTDPTDGFRPTFCCTNGERPYCNEECHEICFCCPIYEILYCNDNCECACLKKDVFDKKNSNKENEFLFLDVDDTYEFETLPKNSKISWTYPSCVFWVVYIFVVVYIL